MSGSVADLIEAIHRRTQFPRTYVAQRARNLQIGGRLRVTVGPRQPAATSRDCVNLLFALTADKARHAPHTATDFEMLARLGERDPMNRRAGDFLEGLIARIWAGNREEARCAVTLWRHPELQVHVDHRVTPPIRFYPPGTLVGVGNADLARVGLHIPGMTIAAIGADIGHKGCVYAT